MKKHSIVHLISKKKTHIGLGLVCLLAVFGISTLFVTKPENVEALGQRRSTFTSPTTTTPPSTTTTSPADATTGTTTPTATATPTTSTATASTPTTAHPTTTTATTAPSASSFPFASSLVGYWKLNGNTSGALGKDNGSTIGNVTYVPGKFGQAAHFDGKSYIEIGDRDYFSPSTFGQKMTTSFWFKPDTYNFTGEAAGTAGYYVNFLGKSDWNTGHEWKFRLYNDTAYDGVSRSKRMSFYAFNAGGGLGAGSYMNSACPVDLWTHVVGVIDGLNTKFYVNGKLMDTDPLSGYNISMTNTGAPLRIGTADKSTYLTGSISNVMIYNRPLDSAEVSRLYLTDLSK